MRLQNITLQIDRILLDPNNYRFHDIRAWRRVQANRFHEQRVQETAFRLLKETPLFELSALKDSIRTNGFVQLEQIVVKPYEAEEGYYIVVEGNRRIAAIKWLLEDQASGITELSHEEIDALTRLNVLLLDTTAAENNNATEVIMAIRHVSGIKEWGAYQQARLIVELLEQPDATFSSVAEKLGMSSREVARRYRASNALKQMETDDEFKELAEPSMYALFHEAVAQPTVREWLGWDNDQAKFTNTQNLHDFYNLICEVDGMPAKIRGYDDVRTKLKQIIPYPRALSVLRDSSKTLDDALQVAIEDAGLNAGSANFELAIKSAIRAIEELPTARLRNLSAESHETIVDLQRKVSQLLDDYRTLRPSEQ